MTTPTLDFEVLETDEEFQVWTPDITGAILGIGTTKNEALLNAIEAMTNTIEELDKSLS